MSLLHVKYESDPGIKESLIQTILRTWIKEAFECSLCDFESAQYIHLNDT